MYLVPTFTNRLTHRSHLTAAFRHIARAGLRLPEYTSSCSTFIAMPECEYSQEQVKMIRKSCTHSETHEAIEWRWPGQKPSIRQLNSMQLTGHETCPRAVICIDSLPAACHFPLFALPVENEYPQFSLLHDAAKPDDVRQYATTYLDCTKGPHKQSNPSICPRRAVPESDFHPCSTPPRNIFRSHSTTVSNVVTHGHMASTA
jgi:hypothetical protein